MRWILAAALLASTGFSLFELMRVQKLVAGLASGQVPSPAALAALAGSGNPAAKIAGAELQSLDRASLAGQEPNDAPPKPAPYVFTPRPEHAEAGDTNSAPGTIVEGRGGGDKAPARGGALLVNADGSRLELTPAARPAPSAAARAEKAVQALARFQPPSLDDPRLGLDARKRRAEIALVACAIGAFLLAFWARRYRIET